MTDQLQQPEIHGAVSSYLDLRRGIGIIGTALPFVLAIGNIIIVRHFVLQRSISAYYYTDMKNILVGSMCAVGVFLLCYRYERIDNIFSRIGGVCAIGVGLFPTSPANPTTGQRIIGGLHLTFAAVFFLSLSYFCFYLFTRSDRSEPDRTARKRLRDRIYRICGVVILVCLVVVVGTELLLPLSVRNADHPAFYGESLAIIAFGVAWFIKGKTILQDQPSTANLTNPTTVTAN